MIAILDLLVQPHRSVTIGLILIYENWSYV